MVNLKKNPDVVEMALNTCDMSVGSHIALASISPGNSYYSTNVLGSSLSFIKNAWHSTHNPVFSGL